METTYHAENKHIKQKNHQLWKLFFKFNENITHEHIFKIENTRCNKSLKLKTFPARSIDQWNSLKEDTVCSETVVCFKTKLDKEWAYKRFNTDCIYESGTVNDKFIGGVLSHRLFEVSEDSRYWRHIKTENVFFPANENFR